MYKTLRELSETTPIALFPEIYNYNNNIISEEIEYFYDSSTNTLKSSVYVPMGKVLAYNGEFRTLLTDNIIINNPATLINSIIKRSDQIPHNAFSNNFSDSSLELRYESVNRALSDMICHDASVIVVPLFKNQAILNIDTTTANNTNAISLYQVIESITAKLAENTSIINDLVNKVYNLGVIKDADDIHKPENYDLMRNKPVDETITYPLTYYYATIVQLKRQGLNPLHIDDLKIPNTNLHTYYTVTQPMEVNNEHYIAIECADIGMIIDIKFKKTNATNPFTFLLTRKNDNDKRTYISIKYDPLTTLQLKCTGYTEEYGTEWSVYNWSAKDPTTIKYEEK